MPEKPSSHYIKMHKQYLQNIVNFRYSFEKGDKDPLKKHLDQVKKIPNQSISGERALRIYEKAKSLGLYKHQPVIMRIYLGQLILKIKPDGSPGFIKFIKFIENESQSLNPLLRNQIEEVIALVKRYGRGGVAKFERMRGSQNSIYNGREADPIFGDENSQLPKEDFQDRALESLNSSVESRLGNLDPFQTIFYKLLIEKGYKKFKKEIINKTGGWKKFLARKEGIQAINRFRDWIVKTTKSMAFSKGKGLLAEFDKRISEISFPSLKITVAFGALTVKDYRAKAKKMVTEGLNEMKPIIKRLTGFPPILYKIIGRTSTYATGKNRVFLNRFYRIASDRFKSASGDQKYLYEFIAMALDRIKDDDEFAKLSNVMKPIIADLIKGSPMIDQLSQKVFKKPISQLSQKQIVSLLDYILPSTALNEDQKESELNKKLLEVLKEASGQLGSLKKTDPEKYRLIANILHIAKNDIVAIGTEKNPVKAKQKLAEFYRRFNLVRSLIGKDIMRKIEETNKYLYMFLTRPETTISFACAFNKNIDFVKKKFEAVSKVKKPEIVVSMLRETYVTKKYLQQRFKQAETAGNITLIQSYGNQLRAIDMAVGILRNCWTQQQFKENEVTIRQILHETPFIMVSENIQKYIDLTATIKVDKAKKNYRSFLGVTYDVKQYVSRIVRGKLFAGRYSFARDRISSIIDKIVASYGEEIEVQTKASGINLYNYLQNYGKLFANTLVSRINEFLKSVRFRDEKGKNYKLYGLNRVQVALLKRNMTRYISKQIMPKVKRAA